jgi:hypothetical protein
MDGRNFIPLFQMTTSHSAPLTRSRCFFWPNHLQLFKLESILTRTIATMVRAIIDRTNLPRTKVEQTAREIQNAGLLKIGRGAIARPSDLANILIALAADKVRQAPATVTQYSSLKRLVECEHPNAGDALEAWITKIWSGDRDAADKTFRIVQSWPEIIITESDDRQHKGEHFYPEDQVMEFHALFDVRRSLEIPGRVIAQIGADLGMRGCTYAA